MPDQVLSQEEIDALLGAMEEGEVDLKAEKGVVAEVTPYDLTAKSIMLRDQFSALEEVNDKFTTSLRNSLSSSLQKEIGVELASMEMIKFGSFLKGFSNPTSFNMFSMEPLIGSALLAIEAELVFCLVDCMFGGNGKPLEATRDFTLIEQRMMRKFVTEVLVVLEQAWNIAVSITNSLRKTETKSEFVHLVEYNDLVLVIVFTIKGIEFSGNMHLCIPYLMLEPIKDNLASSYMRDKDVEHTWSLQLREILKGTHVTVNAEVGNTMYTVRELLGLQVEDVLKLDSGPQDPVIINVEDIPKFEGLPGILKGSRAVQITKLLHRGG